MNTIERIEYHIGGFMLSFVTAAVATAGLYAFVALTWMPLPGLLFAFGSRLAIVSTAIASTVVCLLWLLKNEDMKRGVWCFMYSLIAVAVILLAISSFQ
jgi:hypothetical protein